MCYGHLMADRERNLFSSASGAQIGQLWFPRSGLPGVRCLVERAISPVPTLASCLTFPGSTARSSVHLLV